MNREQIRQLLFASLQRVAPELDPASVAPEADLREELDLDSMDFMTFVRGVHERTGLEVPESDYRQLASLAGAEHYLLEKLQQAS